MKKILVAAALLAGMSFASGPSGRDTTLVKPDSATLAQFKAKFEAAKLELKGKLDSLRLHAGELVGPKDSLRKPDSSFAGRRDSLHKHDSALFSKLPEALKGKIKNGHFDSLKGIDSAKIVDFKVKRDSLRKTWEAKRDSQIANLPDSVKAKIQARLTEISAKRAAVKAKIEARKAAKATAKLEDTTVAQ